jgi:hypothetical protein
VGGKVNQKKIKVGKLERKLTQCPKESRRKGKIGPI